LLIYIFVYNFIDLSFIARLETCPNPTGESGLSMADPITIVYPAEAQGYLAIRCEDPSDPSGQRTLVTRPATIAAHNGKLACIALSMDGKFVATASDKGTLVRVWDTATSHKVREFRRGSDNAQIWCICFSQDNSLLAVSSNKGTCHIFAIQESVASNRQSAFRPIRGILPSYFSSEWSSMEVQIPSEPSILAFSPDKSFLFVVSKNGTCAKVLLEYGATPTAKFDSTLGWYSLLK